MKVKNKKELFEWDIHSSVRARPYEYLLTHDDLNNDLFPRDMLGYFNSTDISALPPESQIILLGCHLVDFLDYTVDLEHNIVNPALYNIATSKTFSGVSESLRARALQFYTDEGYHAYFSHRIASEVREKLAIPKYSQPSLRIKKLKKICAPPESTTHQKDIICFLKAFASETLISKELSKIQSHPLSKPIQIMLNDHSFDEARHCDLFCKIFTHINTKFCLAPHIPTLIDILDVFFKIDKDNLEFRLSLAGIEKNKIHNLLESSQILLSSRKKDRCTTPIRLLKKLGLFWEWEQSFIDRGYI